MPETTMNDYSNGNHHNGYEMEDNSSFLFTSESVGEGHPGKISTGSTGFILIFRNNLLKETP